MRAEAESICCSRGVLRPSLCHNAVLRCTADDQPNDRGYRECSLECRPASSTESIAHCHYSCSKLLFPIAGSTTRKYAMANGPRPNHSPLCTLHSPTVSFSQGKSRQRHAITGFPSNDWPIAKGRSLNIFYLASKQSTLLLSLPNGQAKMTAVDS